jgi:hypothetical protein
MVYNYKKCSKDTSDIDDMKEKLTTDYNFKNITKFNDKTIDIIYKILNYDKIIIL